MKNKVKSIIIVSIFLIISIVFSSLLYLGVFDKQEVVPVVEEETIVDNSDPNRQLWLDNKSLNDDYVGEIIFDSDLINKPFVQAKDV